MARQCAATSARSVPIERASKAMVAGLCVYETVAIMTGRLPMVSQLCRRHRWVEAGLLAVLLTHLHYRLAPSCAG